MSLIARAILVRPRQAVRYSLLLHRFWYAENARNVNNKQYHSKVETHSSNSSMLSMQFYIRMRVSSYQRPKSIHTV